jgi:energy-coupling factor transporter ATP-binding protein EcfA2
MAVKITSLEIENLKRVKAVAITVEGKALTVIGGRNGQGKTSVLDGIMWALGGDRFKPTNPTRDGADGAYIKINLDNGVTVERGGVNGALKVTSSTGKGGQALLNEFVNTFALNLPKFMAATTTEKSQRLLDVFPGLGAKLVALNAKAKALFDERHALGQIADRKAKFAEELPYVFDVPDAPLSGAEMTKKLTDALAVNAANQAKRQAVEKAADEVKAKIYRVESAEKRVADLKAALEQAEADKARAQSELDLARESAQLASKTAAELKDLDTSAIEKQMEEIDSINAKIRANESKRNAEDEAKHLKAQYEQMTVDLETVRAERIKLLASVDMPLPGLSLDEQGQLIYQGQPWDGMSGAEQLRVATAICAAVNPKCGFVLLDKLEAMDTQTLAEFAGWLEVRGLQAIGTRVGTGDECSVVIEDGEVVDTFKFE